MSISFKPGIGAGLDFGHPLSRGLVGCWLFNEGGGAKLWDISGNANHGTLTNMDPSSDWVASPNGGALDFDGSNEYIQTAFNDTLNNFTVIAWFLAYTAASPYERILDKTYDSGFWLGRNDSLANTWGGGILQISAPYGLYITLADEAWHQIASVRSGTTQTIYGDGGAVVATQSCSGTTTSSASMRFGIDALTAGNPWDGKLSQVRVYNRALSPGEIRQLYVDPYCNILQPVYRRYFISTGTGVTIAVPVGSLSLMGQAASAVAPRTVPITVAALTLSGQAPVAVTPRTIPVAAASLTLSGQVPDIVAPRTIPVSAATLTLTGQVPSIASPGNVPVPVGTLSLAGQQPTAITPRTCFPPTGTLSLGGFQPLVGSPRTVPVAVGVLSLTGQVPVIQAGGSLTVQVGASALSLVGHQPLAVAPRVILVGVASLTLAGFAPAMRTNTILRPAAGTLVLSGAAVSLQLAIVPGRGTLTLTGYAPLITGAGTVLVDPTKTTRFSLSGDKKYFSWSGYPQRFQG